LNSFAAREGIADEGTRYLKEFWCSQIGHITHLDIYAKGNLLGWRPPARRVVLAPEERIANRCYLDYWSDHVEIVTDAAAIDALSEKAAYFEDYVPVHDLPDGEAAWLPITCGLVQRQWEEEGRPPLLSLKPSHAQRGWQTLHELGVPRDAWFVSVHVRESGFHVLDPNQEFRNGNVSEYLEAIRLITARGGWVIRLGDASMTPLPPMERVVDYAHSSAKSDWMDVFLAAACRFFVGGQSGMSLVSYTFGVPTVFTNWTSVGIPPYCGKSLFIPKKLWKSQEERYLHIREVLDAGLGHNQMTKAFQDAGVTVISNSADEIKSVVAEMLDRLDGLRHDSPANVERQARLAELLASKGVIYFNNMGREFLEFNEPLLLNSTVSTATGDPSVQGVAA